MPPRSRASVTWRSTARPCGAASITFSTVAPRTCSAPLLPIRRWCWRISTATTSPMRYRPCRPCLAHLACPAPWSPLTPCIVKKTFEQAAAGGVHLIAQLKGNQPALHLAVTALCETTAPLDRVRTADKKRRSRDEVRCVEVFAPGDGWADTEWV